MLLPPAPPDHLPNLDLLFSHWPFAFGQKMERRSDEIFRVHDLSVLRSPMPLHLLGNGNNNGGGGYSGLSTASKQRSPLMATPVVVRRPTPRTPAASTLSALFATPLGKAASSPYASEPKCVDENVAPRNNTNGTYDVAPSMIATSTPAPSSDEKVKKCTRGLASTSLHHGDLGPTQTLVDEKVLPSTEDPAPVAEEKVELPAMEPLVRQKRDASTKTSNSVIDLTHWSLVIVPNNPSVTGYERSVTSEWVVLVGKRTDMVEMWHSSLITGRQAACEITTGSGRIYRLGGSLDESAMVEAGFSFGLVESFRNGFPENWQEHLLQEFSSIREKSAKRSTRSREQEVNGKMERRLDQGRIKRRSSLAGIKAPSPKGRKSELIKHEDPSTDPPYEPINERRRGPNSQRRHSPQAQPSTPPSFNKENPRWRDNLTPVVTGDATILGTTRSGRRVFKPFPYWENKYLGKDLSSPLGSTPTHRTREGKVVEREE